MTTTIHREDRDEEQSYSNNRLDFFEEAGIDIQSLKNKYVRLNVGKMKLEGKVISVNERYGLIKVQGSDGFTTIVRLGKVSMISIKN
jgi:hypothetical protein